MLDDQAVVFTQWRTEVIRAQGRGNQPPALTVKPLTKAGSRDWNACSIDQKICLSLA